MNSTDIDHVPPPNPENFWWFEHRECRALDTGGTFLKLIAIDLRNDRALFRLQLPIPGGIKQDFLNLDAPCVMIRIFETQEPMITVTLRRIESDRVALQVNYNQRFLHEVARSTTIQ